MKEAAERKAHIQALGVKMEQVLFGLYMCIVYVCACNFTFKHCVSKWSRYFLALCVCVCVCMVMYAHTYSSIGCQKGKGNVCDYVCVYIYIYVCVCVCIYIYMV